MTSTSDQPASPPRAPRHSWYRSAELIVAADAVDALTRRLEQDGRRSVASFAPIDGLGVCRVTLDGAESRLPVPRLVRMLQQADPGLVIGPNRLLAPASHIIIRPSGPPAPAPRLANQNLAEDGPIDGPRPRVGVVDTGYWRHPWFAGRVTGFRAGDEDLEADGNGRPKDVIQLNGGREVLAFGAGHGTFVAGRILQEAPLADVIVRRVEVDRPGGGNPGPLPAALDDVDLARAIIEVGNSGIDILNLSLSTRPGRLTQHESTELLATANAIIEVRRQRPNLVIVAPAGNDHSEDLVWPAAFDTVIAVGARDEDGQPAAFSNRGTWVTASAPGTSLVSTFVSWHDEIEVAPPPAHGAPRLGPGDFSRWATWSGTSFSAAAVSGAIADAMVTLSAGPPGRNGFPQLLPAADAAAALLYGNANNPRHPDLGVTLLQR